jgi:hypothetical protein
MLQCWARLKVPNVGCCPLICLQQASLCVRDLRTRMNITQLAFPWIFILLTHSMEQSPCWEVNWISASQETHCILWNPNAYYCIRKYPLTVPILSQLSPVYTPTSQFLKIILYTLIPSIPGSPQLFLYVRYFHPKPINASPLPHTHHIPCLFHSSQLYHPHNSKWKL